MNILVIDDERTILETVLKQLSEMPIAVEHIDGVQSAEEAREKMKEREYEIFLCDIVMPQEDGIHFAKTVLEKKPSIKFIFLTAHANINYMKEAISIQSFDYLLQPASSEELYKVVQKAIAQIRIEKKNQVILEKGKFFLRYEDQLIERGIREYLREETDNKEYIERLFAKKLQEVEEAGFLQILFQVQKTEKKLEEIERELLKSIYQNILQEVWMDFPLEVEILLLDDLRFSCLLCGERTNFPSKEQLKEKLELLVDLFEKLLKTELAVYCGKLCTLEELPQDTLTLHLARENNIRKETGVFFSVEEPMELISEYSFESRLPAWTRLWNQGRLADFEQSLKESCWHYSRKKEMSRDYLVRLHQAVTELILGYLVNHGIESAKIFDENIPYLQYMGCWTDLDTFLENIHQIIEKLGGNVSEEQEDPVEQVKQYIHENLGKNFSVTEIADYVGMNAEYLTRLFKKNTGYSLKEYMTKEKLDAAKILLETTEMSITLISDHVGYGNYSNFTRTFRQAEGCTPMEYRQKAIENQKMQDKESVF